MNNNCRIFDFRSYDQYSEIEFQIRKHYLILKISHVRFDLSSKIEKKRKTQKRQPVEVSEGSIKILRALSDKEAFYFYEAIGKPTGQSAKSLSDFLEKIKSVKLESLQFHLQRKDFQNWFKETLGDSKLASKIEGILPSNNDDMRKEICLTVKNRMKELSKEPITLLVNEDLPIVA